MDSLIVREWDTTHPPQTVYPQSMTTAPTPRIALLAAVLFLTTLAPAQQPQRTRLYLKDGTYQLVLDYQVDGKLVRYHSAERDGAPEDIPLAMVDLPATDRWQQQHAPSNRPVLSPELAAEEAARQSLHPEVAPNLHLPDEDSVLALDTFQSTPELIPLSQNGTDLNRETAHATLKQFINPAAAPHQIVELTGPTSGVQLHTAQPIFFARIGDDDDTPGSGLVVHTQGAGRPTPTGGDARSEYVLERLDPRRDLRVVSSFRIPQLDTGHSQPGIIELRPEPLPGNHWLRLTPLTPLEPGEYALIEVLSAQDINLNVWDFGIHPDAKESYEAIKPDLRKPPTLEHRP